MEENEDEKGLVLHLELMEEYEEVFKLNQMDEHEEIQDPTPNPMDECKENWNPIFAMCKEAPFETLLVAAKTFVYLKFLEKKVFTKCQKYVIMTKKFKQLSINGKNCHNDWIEINKKKIHVL